MPRGNAWVSFPLGPCTSTARSCTFTVTPLGTAMGFFPIRDILLILVSFVLRPSSLAKVLSQGQLRSKVQRPRTKWSPNVAEHFPANAGFCRVATGHHTARRGQNARAQPRQHLRHIVAAEIHATARAADSLHARDQPFPVWAVFQEQTQRLDASLPRGLVEDLEPLDIAFVLQNLRDIALDPRQRHVHTRVLGTHGVANPRQHVSDWICHNSL